MSNEDIEFAIISATVSGYQKKLQNIKTVVNFHDNTTYSVPVNVSSHHS